MKHKPHTIWLKCLLFGGISIVALTASPAPAAGPADPETPPPPARGHAAPAQAPAAATDYGYDTREGTTRKVRKVIGVNPATVTLVYEGGGTRRVPRKDLGEPLRSLYPYDTKEAESYEQLQERRRIQQQINQQDAVRLALLRQQRELLGQIDALQARAGRVQEEIDDLTRQIRTQKRKPALRQQKNAYIDQQKVLRRQIDALQDKLKAIDLQLHHSP